MLYEDKLIFFVNGQKIEVDNPDPETTLLQYLRCNLRLTGTKLGCGEGGCGACTVMVSAYSATSDRIHHYSVNACLAPLCAMHGLAITTVEGIGSLKAGLHPAQERLASAHGSQCGFCTPGFVMSMYTLLRNHPRPSSQQLESAFDGNLCRCTGYRPIIDGYRSFVLDGCGKTNCCQNEMKKVDCRRKNCSFFNEENSSQPANTGAVEKKENILGKAAVYDPTQEPIFPPYLKTEDHLLYNQSLRFVSDRVTWYRPTKLEELLILKQKHPDCRMVIGNTEIGVETKFKKRRYSIFVAVTHVPELLAVEYTETGIRFGSSVTLNILDMTLKEAVTNLPETKTRIFSAFIEMLQWFAGHQIRNVASLGGNIMTASPISDLNPLLLACGAVIHLADTDGRMKEVKMDSSFFVAYRQTIVQESEILVSVLIPFSKENEYFLSYKQAHRKEDDISIVNAGMHVVLNDSTSVVDASFAFGGMAPITVMALKTSTGIIGQKWNEELLSLACQMFAEDLPLDPSAPGGMVAFRRSLTLSFFFKFYLSVLHSLHQKNLALEVPINQTFLSAVQPLESSLPCGSQVYENLEGQSPDDTLHRPLVHQSAYKQATGEAVYLDDMPVTKGELFAAFVLSRKAHARLISVDAARALDIKGVMGFFSHKDVPGKNVWGADEKVFASEEVVHQGQVIGVVVAETQAIAQRAAAAVNVQYEELDSIITIKEAIRSSSFFPPKHEITHGDLAAGFAASDFTMEGDVHIEAQEHFYLECQAVLARPGEDGEMEVFATTQGPGGVQEWLAVTLGVPQHKIVVRTKRLGGGFGGKETRIIPVTLPVAVAAAKLKRSVRCVLDRDEDMMMTATRHPVLCRYKVGFTSQGNILALEVDLYLNAGISTDFTIGVMNKALFHSDNCYNIANLRTTGHMCKTNLPSRTAFRGFGAPQAMIITETWMSQVAGFLKKAPEEIREMNFYKEGDRTHFNQVLEQMTLQQCWEECLSMSRYSERRKQVDIYNSQNRWRKRGLAITPTKFGLACSVLHLNQGGALVHIYVDGSVLVTHGGVEMGQGLHTKMIQVSSRVLQVPVSKIATMETATNTVPNASPTVASISSDIYGEAVRDACQTLRDRLDSFIHTTGKTGQSWEQLIRDAYESRINLSASGFYIIPDIGYDFDTGKGNPFSYFAYGAACSEVEIDCLTGDHVVLQTDIVFDVGKSLNPAIDIGQIEGAFVQGYGLVMLEHYKVQPDGTLLTRGPGAYKIPTLGNIPKVFNVRLLPNSRNPRAVFSSKGIGEPPLLLAVSVLQAVQDAVASARKDAGLEPFIIRDTPATPDLIRMACQDQFTKQIEIDNPDPEATLLQYLRRNCKTDGTKLGSGEGGCGACTFMVSGYSPTSDRIHHYSVNAYLAPLCAMHDLAVTTVEEIGSLQTGLYPAQERLASAHGSQCGFCTPGFVMSMDTLLRNHPRPSSQQLQSAFGVQQKMIITVVAELKEMDVEKQIAARMKSKRAVVEGEICLLFNEENSSQPASTGAVKQEESILGKAAVYDPKQESIFLLYLKFENIPPEASSLRVVCEIGKLE